MRNLRKPGTFSDLLAAFRLRLRLRNDEPAAASTRHEVSRRRLGEGLRRRGAHSILDPGSGEVANPQLEP